MNFRIALSHFRHGSKRLGYASALRSVFAQTLLGAVRVASVGFVYQTGCEWLRGYQHSADTPCRAVVRRLSVGAVCRTLQRVGEECPLAVSGIAHPSSCSPLRGGGHSFQPRDCCSCTRGCDLTPNYYAAAGRRWQRVVSGRHSRPYPAIILTRQDPSLETAALSRLRTSA